MIAGLVLAAGAGTRFGSKSKLLAELDGRPLLEHAVEAACAVAELERVVVVVGAQAPEIRRRVRFGRAEVVVCPDWERGQSFSLRCGVRALPEVAKVIVTLGDAPRIGPAVIARFLDQPPGSRAVYRGRPGHPVVLGEAELAALDTVHGDVGAKELLTGGNLIECGDLSAGTDVDTPRDLEAIRDETRAIL
ncbi:MAG TPA: nucleotidyltransferase family protein [Solirubrobacteraceae bacterium]|nr:nucleotidyltransferase family protein [Solirubrobacteraceae bacterium]